IDLVIRPGERIAIIGENGSGKTTLIKLLAGLYHPTSGKISVDGRDITEIPPQAWRKHLSVVFQDFMRYAFTMRQNIIIGNPCNHQDNEQLQQVIQQAGLQEVVADLPNGLDTLLGREFEGGRDLSMGQWQRVALARALFRQDAVIFVLDEPTAWQDAFEEFEVYRHFERWAEDQKVVILISHRIAPALVADRIILMQHGQIVEQGSHAELMQLGGRYASLYQIQSQQYDMRPHLGGKPVI
ncbi:MAG: ABC transporter ATP-binding protein, partial [Candidatus Hadarchaeum sp.]